jgi:hypothetical protein
MISSKIYGHLSLKDLQVTQTISMWGVNTISEREKVVRIVW